MKRLITHNIIIKAVIVYCQPVSSTFAARSLCKSSSAQNLDWKLFDSIIIPCPMKAEGCPLAFKKRCKRADLVSPLIPSQEEWPTDSWWCNTTTLSGAQIETLQAPPCHASPDPPLRSLSSWRDFIVDVACTYCSEEIHVWTCQSIYSHYHHEITSVNILPQ